MAVMIFNNPAGQRFTTATEFGHNGVSTGQAQFSGTTSGTVTVKSQNVAGSYNFNLPTDAGTAGQPLLSGGGGASPQTYGTLGTISGGTSLSAANDVSATFITRALSTGVNGSTNNSSSGSGSFAAFTPTVSVPANYLVQGRMLRVRAIFRLTTGSSAPTLNISLRLGGIDVVTYGPQAPANNLSAISYGMDFAIVALAAPGASTSVESCLFGNTNSLAAASLLNGVAQPVSLATNGALTLDIRSKWDTAGTGTNTVTLVGILVESVN